MPLKLFPPCFDWFLNCLFYLFVGLFVWVYFFGCGESLTDSLMKAIEIVSSKTCVFLHSHKLILCYSDMKGVHGLPEICTWVPWSKPISSHILQHVQQCWTTFSYLDVVACFMVLPHIIPASLIHLMNRIKPTDLFISLTSSLGLSSLSLHTYRGLCYYSPLWPCYIWLLSKYNKIIQGRQCDLRLKRVGVRMTWVWTYSRSEYMY